MPHRLGVSKIRGYAKFDVPSFIYVTKKSPDPSVTNLTKEPSVRRSS